MLKVEHLTVKDKNNFEVVKDVSFSIRSGEVFAIAGVSGNGQVEIADAIAGLMPVTEGKILLNNEDITHMSIRKRTEVGIGYIPEDRQIRGLILDYTMEDNMVLKVYKNEPFSKNGLINRSLCVLLNYIYNTQKQVTSNINNINVYNSSNYMVLDMFTRSNLELTETIRTKKKKGSLLHVLDKTSTAMGGRMLRKYVEEPLVDKKRIQNRLDVIEEIKDDYSLRIDLIEILKNVYDIERICGKIAFEKVTPKEMIHLKNSVEKLPMLKNLINSSNAFKNLKTCVILCVVDRNDASYCDGAILKPLFII